MRFKRDVKRHGIDTTYCNSPTPTEYDKKQSTIIEATVSESKNVRCVWTFNSYWSGHHDTIKCKFLLYKNRGT